MSRFHPIRTILLASLSILAMAAGAKVSHAETLRAALEQALNTHPSVRAAIARRDAAEKTMLEQNSRYFPEISARAAGGRVYGDNSTSRGLTVTRDAAYSGYGEGAITMTQMLYDGFETPSRVKAARDRTEAEGFGLADLREDLAARVAQAYLNVRRAYDALALVEGQEKAAGAYLEKIRARVKEGASEESEIHQAQNILLMLKNTREDYRNRVRAASARYMELVGTMPDGALEIPQPLSASIPESLEAALAQAQQENPLLQVSDLTAAALEDDVAAEKGTLYPDLNAELSYLKRDQRDEIGGEVIDGKALVRVSWNFSTGGAQLARIDRKKIEHEAALARRQDTLRQIEREVRTAYADLESARAKRENSRERVTLMRGILDNYKAQFEAARIGVLQLMQADNQSFTANLEKLDAEYNALIAEYTLLGAIGTLQDALLVRPAATQTDDRKTATATATTTSSGQH